MTDCSASFIAVCTQTGPYDIPTRDVCHSCDSKITIGSCLPRPHHCLLKITVDSRRRSTSSTPSPVKNHSLHTYTSNAICYLKELPRVTELRSFFAFCNASRWLTPNFARIAGQGYHKLSENQPRIFEDLSDKERAAMKLVQEWLLCPPILSLRSVIGWSIVIT